MRQRATHVRSVTAVISLQAAVVRSAEQERTQQREQRVVRHAERTHTQQQGRKNVVQ